MISPKSKHRRDKSGVISDEMPILQGWLTRESTVVDRLLNKRFGAIYPSVFATYRKDNDDSPSKMWSITKETTLSPIEKNEYNLRHPGTSTLWALASGSYDVKEMHAFTVSFSGIIGTQEKLVLAFDTIEQAEQWHLAFSDAISKAESDNISKQGSSSQTATSFEEAPSRSTSSETTSDAGPIVPQAKTILNENSDEDKDLQSNATTLNDKNGSTATQNNKKHRSWASVLHINGVSVYLEEQDDDGDGGAVMVSAVVRAPPMDVFKSLVQVRSSQGLGIFAGARTVEVIDSTTQVIAQTWKGSGIASSICAPREMVLLRTWRKDEDGTYIVLYQSTNHCLVPKHRGWGWKAPVRVRVQAAGFTIAPLLPEYTVAGESHESLVTLVLKANLGGFLSKDSVTHKLASPLAMMATRSMLEPLVTSIVILRDRVEQNRFVVRPLSMNPGEMVDEEGSPSSSSLPLLKLTAKGGHSGATSLLTGVHESPKIYRTSTMLLYRDRSLFKETEEHASGGGAAAASSSMKETIMEEEEDASMAAVEDVDSWAIEGCCMKQYWTSPGNCGFKLRGSTYLTDKKKVVGAPPMFELVAVDLLEFEEPMHHVCRYLPSVKNSPAPFLFCVQMMVPSTPPVSLIASWAAPMPVFGRDASALIDQFEKEQESPCPENVAAFFRNLTDFIQGDGPDADKNRNIRFKLIPNISKGSWIIKQSVGTTPVLLGQKLKTKYFRGSNYFEVDVDIGSSSVAASITNLVCGATKSLALDMGLLLEGQKVEHLPEQLIGTIRLDKLDLKTAAYFDEATGKILKIDRNP